MNTDDYWNRFKATGNISDYLTYKGMEMCEQTWNSADKYSKSMPQTGDDFGKSISSSDWYGAVSSANGRL